MAKETSYAIFSKLNPFKEHCNKDKKDGMYQYIPSNLNGATLKNVLKWFKTHTG